MKIAAFILTLTDAATNCNLPKVTVTGANLYSAINHLGHEKQQGHFNGVYSLDEDHVIAGKQVWTKTRGTSTSVRLQYVDDIYGGSAWVLTNQPGQPRFFTFSVEDCPSELKNWNILPFGISTEINDYIRVEEVKVAALKNEESTTSAKYLTAQFDYGEMDYANDVSDIYTMLFHYLPDSHMKLHYYACNGVHTLDIFQTIQASARPSADPVNDAINSWKLCRRCSNREFENDEKIAYDYDLENEICCDEYGSAERGICECDRNFLSILRSLEIPSADSEFATDPRDCESATVLQVEDISCCYNRNQNLMTAFHQIRQCCSDEGVVMPAGQCPAEIPEDIQKDTFFTAEEIRDIENDRLNIAEFDASF